MDNTTVLFGDYRLSTHMAGRDRPQLIDAMQVAWKMMTNVTIRQENVLFSAVNQIRPRLKHANLFTSLWSQISAYHPEILISLQDADEAYGISFLSSFIVPEDDGSPLESGEAAACRGSSFKEVGIPETSWGNGRQKIWVSIISAWCTGQKK